MKTVLSNSCETLSGVGDALTKKLAKCGIHSLQDLLWHLPYRYQDRTRVTAIQDLQPHNWYVVAGSVCKTEIKYGKRRMLDCYLEDKTGLIKLRFFHFNQQQTKALTHGKMIRVFGETRGFAGMYEMVHPEYQILQDDNECPVEETLTPIYSSTQGLSQNRLRQLVQQALKTCEQQLQELEWMSDAQLQQQGFIHLAKALHLLHHPPPDTSLKAIEEGRHPALKRLVFEELLAHHLSLSFARQTRRSFKAPALTKNGNWFGQFLSSLPFQLTAAQQRVWSEIEQDLQGDNPMLRLVQGDVGSGKTVLAALAALKCIANGYQAAFMAPTELLSEQHANTFCKWLQPLGIQVLRLSGKMKSRERKQVLSALENHDCQLLIGTHALFQERVSFATLGLVIIDEQHRFGVEQRLQLQQKGLNTQQLPHQLLMTATPIPRTLSMTHFAHLDLSVIDELPPGRTPVVTAILNQEKRAPLIERLQTVIASGRQAYWVCTLIEESEKLQCMAATETAKALAQQLSGIRVGLIHGRMKAEDKESCMQAFKAGDIDLLVATTVIEVGVDVPNASLMIIENAERLGLSQLHQLRGRVGRGHTQSHCLLLYQPPLSQQGGERLKIMRATNDGFMIAEKDLQLRGAGEILGSRQSGYRQFKIADLQRDRDLLSLLPGFANALMQQHQSLAQVITKRWLGQFEQFLQG